MAEPLALSSVCRLPAPGDNVAIAIRRFDAGECIAFADGARTLAHTVLEGHRFAVRAISGGDALLSWGLPFGTALVDIAAGEYVCNQSMLAALAVRNLDPKVRLPERPNFADRAEPFRLNEEAFRPGPPVERVLQPRTFLGYARAGSRGVGTRNVVVIVGTTSRTASFARQLTARLQPLARVHPGLDGLVAIAHTEGGGTTEPNNCTEILRALAGFMVHPNVAAVLAVDYGVEPITNARLAKFMREHRYPLDDVPHAFLSLKRGLTTEMAEGERIVREWLPRVASIDRTPQPVSALRIALQCGGSDAFSGVSGNPLAGAVVHEIVRQGGTGVLTETDEAMGAEHYLLNNIRDLATAHALLARIDSFRERLRWHGVTAESNPSAGNKFRGLYNITLKSLGAVHKKDPRTRIDFVCDYAEPLREPGFHFMNGPGNDLEGVAGQIASGCNLVLFVTGNGSITNFPFVPTLKITSTTRRHELLAHEMDINAGKYLDGVPMDVLVSEAVELVAATASGARTKGERAGHSQVSIWRNWRQTDASRVAEVKARAEPDGKPLPLVATPRAERNVDARIKVEIPVYRTDRGIATERVGLVLPTSLCSAQIARLAAERLNAKELGRTAGIARFVSLPHTEGCGFGGESMYHLLYRTYRGYLLHPNVAVALLLEHGCEKIPNDAMRRQLESAGIPLARFGWASVQLDGGITKVLDKVDGWFAEAIAALPTARASNAGLGALNLAVMTSGPVGASTAGAIAAVVRAVESGGGSVLMPESDPLLKDPAFAATVLGVMPPHATLAYGQPIVNAGFHVVATDTEHWVENLTGLAGSGAHLALTVTSGHAQQVHPLVPVLQVAESEQRGMIPADDIDAFLSGARDADTIMLARLVETTLRRETIPAGVALGLVDFQLTRGLLGVTT